MTGRSGGKIQYCIRPRLPILGSSNARSGRWGKVSWLAAGREETSGKEEVSLTPDRPDLRAQKNKSQKTKKKKKDLKRKKKKKKQKRTKKYHTTLNIREKGKKEKKKN